MTRINSRLWMLLIPLCLGCEGAAAVVIPDTPQVVTGTWTGISALGRLEMVLAEDAGGRVTGSGFIRAGARNIAFDVTGANAFPDVALSLRFGGEAIIDPQIGAELVSYRAQFHASDSAISLVGQLNGGFLRDVVLRATRN
jgi:hypothetical protein